MVFAIRCQPGRSIICQTVCVTGVGSHRSEAALLGTEAKIWSGAARGEEKEWNQFHRHARADGWQKKRQRNV